MLLGLGLLALAMTTAAAAPLPFRTSTQEEAIATIDRMVETRRIGESQIRELGRVAADAAFPVKVRERAAWALGRLDAREEIPALVKATEDRGLLVRSAALDALLHLRAQAGVPAFIRISAGDPILPLRRRAILALGLTRHDSAVEPLAQLSQDEREEIRGAAALAIGALHSRQFDFSEVFDHMEQDSSAYVRERVEMARNVAFRRNARVHGHFSSPDPEIRLLAAFYLHYNGDAPDLPPLRAALRVEGSDEVRYEIDRAVTGIERAIARRDARRRAQEEARRKAAEDAKRRAIDDAPAHP